MNFTHVRRCHVCGTVNEGSNAAIHRCLQCGKHLAPFYYFDESKLDALQEGKAFLSVWKDSMGYNPIYGLSIYWQESDWSGEL